MIMRSSGIIARTALADLTELGLLPPAPPPHKNGLRIKHSLLRLGQHPLQHHHRDRNRRPAGGELRDLPAWWRQPSQRQQESESAGCRINLPAASMRRAVMISRAEESAG